MFLRKFRARFVPSAAVQRQERNTEGPRWFGHSEKQVHPVCFWGEPYLGLQSSTQTSGASLFHAEWQLILSLSVTDTDPAIHCEAEQKPGKWWKNPEIDLSWTDLYQSFKQFKAGRKGDPWALLLKTEQGTTFSLPFPSPLLFFLCSYSKQTGSEGEAFTGDCSPWTVPGPARELPAHSHSLHCYKAHLTV